MKSNLYETQQYLSEYLLFHYGRPREVCPVTFVPKEALRFHERIREECLLPIRLSRPARNNSRLTRGLDLGCGVGRFTFELGLVVDEALGSDNSRRFITAARRMATQRLISSRIHESGKVFKKIEMKLPKALRGSAVNFQVGDATNLSDFPNGAFDIVAAINLICRLPHPTNFLRQLHRIVKPAGQLVIASPFSWLGGYTPQRQWLDVKQVIRILAPSFKFIRRRELPFMIREHKRKYQLVVSEVLTFVRK